MMRVYNRTSLMCISWGRASLINLQIFSTGMKKDKVSDGKICQRELRICGI